MWGFGNQGDGGNEWGMKRGEGKGHDWLKKKRGEGKVHDWVKEGVTL
jgi:hypothetical protein